MKKVNNNGFGKVELMAMLALIAILLAFGSKYVLDATSNNYGSFKTLANRFANAVSLYKDEFPNDENTYYLHNVIERGFIESLKNPLDASQYCDEYKSFVEVPAPNNKIVTLSCGNYLVQGVQNQSYNVYEVGEWTETQTADAIDSDTLYNYKKNGTLVLDKKISKNDFLKAFYEKEGKNLSDPFSVNQEKDMSLELKHVYRTKTLLKEIK